MADLNERLRGIDRLTPPDLWEAAKAKADAEVLVSTHPSGWRRAAIIAASLVLGLAAVAWVVTAIRPTTSPPVIADQPVLSPAPRADCLSGLVSRTAPVDTSEFVALMSGYLPTWMPEGFGLAATFGPELAADGFAGYGIWTDESCREVELTFNPNWKASSRGVTIGSTRSSVGPWAIATDSESACGNAVLRAARCLRYEVATTGGHLTLTMIGLDRAEGDHVALSIYSGEPFYFPTTPNPPSGDLALFQGPLLERDGCLFMDGGDQKSLPLWPEGYTIQPASSGALQVVDADGTPVALVGGEISMGGGYVAEFFPAGKVEPRDEQIAAVESQFDLVIPKRCLGPDVYGIWLVGSTDVAQPTSTPPSEPVEESFIPPTTTEGAITTLPLVFPDGSRAVVTYPEGLRLAELGLTPQTLLHSTQSNGCGWEPIIRFGDPHDDLYRGPDPVISPPEGGPTMWEGKGGAAYYLAFEFGDWSVNVPCDRSDFDDLVSWQNGLQGQVTADGFLVLETTPPIVSENADPDVSYGPGFVFGTGDDVGFVVLTLGTRCETNSRLLRRDDSASWCVAIGDGAIEITVQTPKLTPDARRFIDGVVEGLQVRTIDVNVASAQ